MYTAASSQKASRRLHKGRLCRRSDTSRGIKSHKPLQRVDAFACARISTFSYRINWPRLHDSCRCPIYLPFQSIDLCLGKGEKGRKQELLKERKEEKKKPKKDRNRILRRLDERQLVWTSMLTQFLHALKSNYYF